MDQECLCRVAHAHALRLRVHDDGLGGLQVGRSINVDMAVAGAGLDHRNARLLDDSIDEPRSAARNQSIDRAARTHHRASTLASPRVHGRNRVSRKPHGSQRVTAYLDEDTVGGLGGTAATQDHRVTGLERQGCSVNGDVGTGLVDDANDAQRHTLLRDAQTDIRAHTANDLTDRVRKTRNLPDSIGDAPDALGCQSEAIQQALAHLLRATAGYILGISSQDLVAAFDERSSNRLESAVLRLCGHIRENASSRAGGIRHLGNICSSIHSAMMTHVSPWGRVSQH